ncbi:MAG: hypothetical protein HOP29_00300, partial [Phycisphaerales bacterium]|nr:hypothetical protein [Phycisphaerales bacterium]
MQTASTVVHGGMMNGIRSIRVHDLARTISGDVEGDGAHLVRGVATLEAAGEGDVSWAGGAELMPRAAESKAGVLVVPRGVAMPPVAPGSIGDAGPRERTVIRVDDPDAAMNKVLAYFAPPRDEVSVG